MSFTMKAVLGLTAMAAGCLSAAGCGSSAPSAGTTSSNGAASGTSTAASQPDPLAGLTGKQIASKAINGLKSAPSFTLTGTGPYDGKTATMSIGVKANGCTMSMDMGSQGSMTMIMIGNTMWMKADAAFWKSAAGSQSGGADAESMFAGKYLKIPGGSSSGLSPAAGTCNRNEMTSPSSSIPLSADVVKGALTTVNGQRVYPLTDKSEDGTAYVTDTSAPRIIKIVSTKPGDSAQFTVAYGGPAAVTAPPASETATMP